MTTITCCCHCCSTDGHISVKAAKISIGDEFLSPRRLVCWSECGLRQGGFGDYGKNDPFPGSFTEALIPNFMAQQYDKNREGALGLLNT